METRSLLQCFAVDKNGRVRAVEEVARGLACDCVCPTCGEAVVAKQGEIRGWHFAHVSGAECVGAAESALHHAAKQTLVDAKGMHVPESHLSHTDQLPDGRTTTGSARMPGGWVDFLSAEVERPLGLIKPDVLTFLPRGMLMVEIAVTHFADSKKISQIEGLAIPTIEIDLASMNRSRWDWDTLQELVVDADYNKEWLWPMEYGQLLADAVRSAIMPTSVATPAQREPSSPWKASRTRYFIDGRIVDVTSRPFGVCVWSPYDPVLTERLKMLTREFGGIWQPKFKNWLLPLEALETFSERLTRLADRPPEKIDK